MEIASAAGTVPSLLKELPVPPGAVARYKHDGAERSAHRRNERQEVKR